MVYATAHLDLSQRFLLVKGRRSLRACAMGMPISYCALRDWWIGHRQSNPATVMAIRHWVEAEEARQGQQASGKCSIRTCQ